jgi:hypothetical protein
MLIEHLAFAARRATVSPASVALHLIRSLRPVLGLCLVWTSLSVTARAADIPDPYTIDAGPIGKLEISGGLDGYVYGLSGAGSSTSLGLLGTSTDAGIQFLNGLVQIQKPDGMLRFTIQGGAVNSLTLGTRPNGPSIQTFSTGPLRRAYVTIAPTSELSLSVGQVDSLEGWESSIDWENTNLLTTALWYTENSQSVGIRLDYNHGPFSGAVVFSDGFDTNVWNYIQMRASYAINKDNNVTLYGATNLGSTGLNARFYGNATTAYHSTTVGSAGVANLVNSSVVGGYYQWNWGSLTLVPEVQYVWSGANDSAGLTKSSSNLGAALFASYHFEGTSISLGGWVEYFNSNGPEYWFLNPGAQGFGFAVGPTYSPEWAKKHLFVRGDIGLLHLTRIGNSGSIGYGSGQHDRDQATFLLEAGVLF